MSTTTPIRTTAAERMWFLDNLVTIHVARDTSDDGISVIEVEAPFGDSPPLHIHRDEDEVFHVLEGELLIRLGDAELSAMPGDIFCAPQGVPHSYRVESPDGARFLVTTTHGGFESLVRTVARPAETAALPAPSGPPTEAQIAQLAELCAQFGIDLVGPPL